MALWWTQDKIRSDVQGTTFVETTKDGGGERGNLRGKEQQTKDKNLGNRLSTEDMVSNNNPVGQVNNQLGSKSQGLGLIW